MFVFYSFWFFSFSLVNLAGDLQRFNSEVGRLIFWLALHKDTSIIPYPIICDCIANSAHVCQSTGAGYCRIKISNRTRFWARRQSSQQIHGHKFLFSCLWIEEAVCRAVPNSGVSTDHVVVDESQFANESDFFCVRCWLRSCALWGCVSRSRRGSVFYVIYNDNLLPNILNQVILKNSLSNLCYNFFTS